MDYFYDLWLGYTICYYNISFCVTVVIEGKKNFELFTFWVCKKVLVFLVNVFIIFN